MHCSGLERRPLTRTFCPKFHPLQTSTIGEAPAVIDMSPGRGNKEGDEEVAAGWQQSHRLENSNLLWAAKNFSKKLDSQNGKMYLDKNRFNASNGLPGSLTSDWLKAGTVKVPGLVALSERLKPSSAVCLSLVDMSRLEWVTCPCRTTAASRRPVTKTSNALAFGPS